METLTKEQFIEYLVEHEACKPGLDWAKAQVSARDIIEKCPDIGHLRWLIETIGDPLWSEYNKKQAQLWTEYGKKIALSRAEYDNQTDQLFTEYYENLATIRAEFNKQTDSLILEICTFERVQAEIGS